MHAEDASSDARRRGALIRVLAGRGGRPRLAMRGTSMAPALREPMVLELEAAPRRPGIGSIVVFESGDRLTAHRVVGYTRAGDVLTAGDAHSHQLEVVSESRIVGSVSAVWSNAAPEAVRVDDVRFRLRGALFGYRGLARVVAAAVLRRSRTLVRAGNPRRRPRPFAALFKALAAILHEDAIALRRHLASVDARLLLEVARRHRCAAILADGLEELGATDAVEPFVWRALQTERWSAALRAAALRAQVCEVVAALCRADLVPILLKGAARVYTAEPGFDRHESCDIDFLLPVEQLDRARRVLDDAGYREGSDPGETRPGHHHRPPLFPSHGGLPLEIHHALAPSGTVRRATDAKSLAPWIRYVPGPEGTAGVLDGIGAALHLAIHAREPATPLRDLVLLARRLRAMTPAERDALYHIVEGEGAERLRLHGVLYGAAWLAGIEWAAPDGAVRYLRWRLRRGDLPTLLRAHSDAVDAVVAGAGCNLPQLARALRPYHGHLRGGRLERFARFAAFGGARAVMACCAGCYAVLLRSSSL